MAEGAALHGHVEEPFGALARVFERQVLRHGGGAALCAYHRGHKVLDVWAGTRDAQGHPWLSDTMAMSFSTSKGVLATLIHVLADRGEIAFDEPVARYWPEFGQAGKQAIRVRDVLCHRAGLPQIRPLIDGAERLLDWEHMVRALERARPRLRPGGASAYHAFTFGWLAGELVRRVTGLSLPEAIERHLAAPLALDGLYIGAPPAARARAAALPRPRPLPSPLASLLLSRGLAAALGRASRAARLPLDPLLVQDALVPARDAGVLFEERALSVPIPAANGLFTARSLARLYAVLAGDGALDGVRLLSPATVRRAAEVQDLGRDRVLQIPMRWRLGYHAAFTLRGRVEGAFGHFGYGGSGAWADPTRHLALALVTNRLGGGPLGDWRIAELGSAALASAA